MSGTATAQNSVQSAQSYNFQARNLLLENAKRSRQGLFSQTFVPNGSNNTLSMPVRNVGLITGFWVHVQATLNNAGAAAITPTAFGIDNLLSNITFNDFGNYQRINSSGWHLAKLASLKMGRVVGGSVQFANAGAWGNNWNLYQQPVSIAAGGNGTLETWYHVPIARSRHDLTGIINAMQLQNQATLSVTVNQNPIAAAGSDGTLAVYQGSTGAGSITSATVTVYQDYLDQLPVDANGNYVVPPLDSSMIYELKTETKTGIVAGQDYQILVPNFRQYLSLLVIYDNGGTLNNGTDINYIALQTANLLAINKVDPRMQALSQRMALQADLPAGTYAFPWYDQPLDTSQYGNMSVTFNPSSAAANSMFLCGWEDIGVAAVMLQASSLRSM